ncbi:hypothetical protein MASR2M78_30980 [Treponema sp.]
MIRVYPDCRIHFYQRILPLVSLADIQVELLRIEFPSLKADQDPDVERYFDMRRAGRATEALSLYESKLRPRYPDDAFRARLLKAFRLHSSEYERLLSEAYLALGSRVLEQVKRTLKYIALKAEAFDPKDAYSTIKAAESILVMLPKERFEAIAAIERLRRYADRLQYKEKALAVTEDLVRAYLTESLSVVEDAREMRRRAREQQIVERRRRLVEQDRADMQKGLHIDAQRASTAELRAREKLKERRQKPKSSVAALDLSQLRFSAADLSRIQVPPRLSSLEDKTLAFCFKYWNLIHDDAFERVLFLYSRKYASKHYDVFSAIRLGRRGGRRDEEILTAIVGILTTGYYYSIRGDVYLQRNWALLKKKLEAPTILSQKTAPQRTIEGRIRKKPSTTIPTKPPSEVLVEKPKKETPKTRPIYKRITPVVPVPKQRSPGGSVSDRLKKLSGRSYDVYEERFLSKSRVAIRSVLGEGRGRFPNVPQEVEELIFAFLRDHYSDPYMNWQESEQKKRVEELGYSLDTIDTIIEAAYKRL